MVGIATQIAPLTGPTAESKMHKAATGFVATFFTQMVEEMFKEVAESSEESNFETEMYGSFLAQGIAEKIAASNSSHAMVAQVENKMRHHAGLDELKSTPPTAAHNAYAGMIKMREETKNVCAPAA